VLAGEAPHNINDHASTSGLGILTTIAGTISQTGANVISGDAPYILVLGPEHARTIHRDGWSIQDIQEKIYTESAVHISRVSAEQRAFYETRTTYLINDRYHLSRSPGDIQILVAGGPGKHSAYIPSFGHNEACSVRIAQS
jgi:hypothetical protein